MELWEEYKAELDALLSLRDQSIDAAATINRYFSVYPGGVEKEVLDAWQTVYEWLMDTGE